MAAMRPRVAFLLAILLMAGASAAETCPQAPDRGIELARLVEAVRAAPNARAAQLIVNDMWAIWADAPNEQAQAILDRGMNKRANFDLLGALEDFDTLIDYCPDYAEGYNQRAFVNFIAQDYAAALADLDRALELSPTHLGALTGRAMAFIALGRTEEARHDLLVALDLNPWLPERGILDALPSEPAQPDL